MNKPIKIRLTADVLNDQNEWKTQPFVMTYTKGEFKPFLLSAANQDYSMQIPFMVGYDVQKMFDRLRGKKLKNISLLFKDKEHLDLWQPILEKHSDLKVLPPESKDIEEVSEGLEYLRNDLNLE